MRTTLFEIPDHVFLGLPLFGVGWLLVLWVLISLATAVMLWRRQGWSAETLNTLLVMALVGGAIVFLSPMIVHEGVLAVRGYGVMVMLGVVLGVGLAAWRAGRMGLDPEHIFSLAFWMVAAGILGARVFFVVQNWRNFDSLGEVLNFTQGGLVVYGSVIGGLVAAVFYLRRRGLPVLAVADLIAPSMLLGLALGRLGCLLNGCCFGGVCDPGWSASVTFPAGSPPYQRQLELGQLVGLRLDVQRPEAPRVAAVIPGSPAARAGVEAGDTLTRSQWTEGPPGERMLVVGTAAGRRVVIKEADLPPRSLPVHPTQIYSSIGAGLLCFFLLMYYPFRRRDGEVFGWMITLYPVGRFLIEVVRDDEPGRLGTPLTISQLVSLAVLLGAAVWWAYLLRRPVGSALPPSADAPAQSAPQASA